MKKLEHRLYSVISKGYIDCYIEMSERMVTKKLTVNSGDFHAPQNF